uniref:Uncharacterized protein n=1 Tax=Rhizophora mucronata TaxID=61149 RepID=A0A2P2NDA9_RHIMU
MRVKGEKKISVTFLFKWTKKVAEFKEVRITMGHLSNLGRAPKKTKLWLKSSL